MLRNIGQYKNIVWGCVVAGLLGAFFFFFIYGELLNPVYDDWLMGVEPDPTQHYMGWMMFRESAWTFPIGVATTYGIPTGIPITYTDSIPLFAIFFKVFRSWLPETFQYFGLWTLMSLMLQGVFGFLLSFRVFKKNIPSIIASLFFVLSPIIWFRFGGHFALGGQWIILAGLYLMIRSHTQMQWVGWMVVLITSLLIHPYLAFMNIALMIGDMFFLWTSKHVSTWHALLFLCGQLFAVVCIAYVLGIFYVQEPTAPGYGLFSMNMNAIINPRGWSQILPTFSFTSVYQMEGFNFMGAGTLSVVVVSIVFAFLTLRRTTVKYVKTYWVYICIGMLLTALAVTPRITFGDTVFLLDGRLPDEMTSLGGLVRSSGRLFWPVYYMIIVYALWNIRHIKKIGMYIILLGGVIIQLYDIAPILTERGKVYENISHITTLSSSFWDEHMSTHDELVFIPHMPADTYMDFILQARHYDTAVVNGSFARTPREVSSYVTQLTHEAQHGVWKKGTIYVITQDVENYDSTKIEQVDGVFVVIP